MPNPEALPRDKRAQEAKQKEVTEAKATSEQEKIEEIPPPPTGPPPKITPEEQAEGLRAYERQHALFKAQQ
jgi:hypothetical protein